MKKNKLHLGCGYRYLEGYINIDLPSEHNCFNTKPKLDKVSDIRNLKYSNDSVDEIRLHHVFEHFPRHIACALLVSWRSWLKNNGILHIEVPDFSRTSLSILNPLSDEHTKAVGLRHLFGSNEAIWASHLEGWSKQRLCSLLKNIGYDIVSVKNNSWLNTYNISIIAKKNGKKITEKQYRNKIEKYLHNFILDDSKSELHILQIWMKDYDKQLKTNLLK